MGTFLKVDGDKFSDKVTTTTDKLNLSKVKIKLRHISFADGNDSLVIDVYRDYTDSWIYIRSGELILNINDSINIRLKAYENYTNSSTFKNNQGEIVTSYSESAFYNITKEQLAAICEANTLDIKVRGSDGSIISNGDKFLIYCRKFYNQFYDSTKYPETANMEVFGIWNQLTNWFYNLSTAGTVLCICLGSFILLLIITLLCTS